MQIIKKKEKLGNIIFYIAICLELLIMMTDQMGMTLALRGRIAQLAFVFFCCKILFTYYTKKEWFFIIVAGLIGSLSYFSCGDEYILRVIVMIVAAKSVEMKKVIKLILITIFAVTILMAVLSALGIHGSLYDIRDFGRGKVECRWKFGFNHANNLHDTLWYMTACYFLLREKKSKWMELAVFTLLNLGLLFFTKSRNGFLATQIIICAVGFFKLIPKSEKQKWPYLLGFGGFISCIYITLRSALIDIYESDFNMALNQFFNGRIEMVYMHAPLKEWMLFPPSREIIQVDNGFAKLFYSYGIVIGIIYLLLLLLLFYRYMKASKGVAMAIVVTAIFVTFMESTFVFNVPVLTNICFVLLADQWYCHQEAIDKI